MIEHFSLTPSIPTLLLISPFPQLNSGAKLQIVQISGPECLYQWFFWLEMPFLFHEFPNLFSLFIASLRFHLKKCFLWKSFRLTTNQVFPHRWPQSLPASGSFPMSQLFTLGGQSIGVSALASFLPKNTYISHLIFKKHLFLLCEVIGGWTVILKRGKELTPL